MNETYTDLNGQSIPFLLGGTRVTLNMLRQEPNGDYIVPAREMEWIKALFAAVNKDQGFAE